MIYRNVLARLSGSITAGEMKTAPRSIVGLFLFHPGLNGFQNIF